CLGSDDGGLGFDKSFAAERTLKSETALPFCSPAASSSSSFSGLARRMYTRAVRSEISGQYLANHASQSPCLTSFFTSISIVPISMEYWREVCAASVTKR